MLLKERQYLIIEEVCRRDRSLRRVQLAESSFAVGVDKRLLINATNAFEISHIDVS